MAGRKKGGGGHEHRHPHTHGVRREDTDGAKTMAKLARISQKKQDEDTQTIIEART